MESSCSLRKDFNSQPHEEADCRSIQRMQGFSYFNSQPHEEADGPKNPTLFFYVISTHSLTKRLTLYVSLWVLCQKHFNSQPHEEADWAINRELIKHTDFNSQPHEEADFCHNFFTPFISHFNSQPHEEADAEHLLVYCNAQISTHSLTKRLTVSADHSSITVVISTHSLTKRLTTICLYWALKWIFQLTASRRG